MQARFLKLALQELAQLYNRRIATIQFPTLFGDTILSN
jgi:hypothetical protein